MKKLLVVLMVLAFAVPAMAADNLSIKGEYYVTGWAQENFFDLDSDDKTSANSYWIQRFRLQPTFKAADGVSGTLRMDFNEDVWGNYTVRPAHGNSAFHVDRAYVDIKKGMVDLRVGHQFFGVGQNQVYRENQTGIVVKVKTPVSIRLAYIKRVENGNTDEDDLDTEDQDRYLLDLGYDSDAINVRLFHVMTVDDRDNPDTPNVTGLYVKSKIGPVAIKGEVASFGGTNEAVGGDVDYTGIQLNIDASLKISDMISVAAELIYSDGEDDADKNKVTFVGSPFARKSLVTGGGMFGDYYAGNWNSGGTPVGSDGVFNPLGDETGALGLGLGVKISPMEKLAITAYLHYLTASEEIDLAFENALVYQAVVTYALAPKTKLQAAYLAADFDRKDVDDLDQATSAWLNLTISF